ncbi:MAG: 6,7-dimethyl-8-ribityllumazine synthase [Bacteroidales bacterium]|jgi:6,7-dimethyl-8-ribityllumazine synthase
MSTKNLSEYNPDTLPDASKMRIGIVVSEWNYDVTVKLLEGAREFLLRNNVDPKNIHVAWVPGSFELIYGAARMEAFEPVDAVIALGSVIRGETPHFEYVCSGVTQGIARLNAKGTIPFIFGLLTTDDMQQALNRAGGIHGNKGVEAAKTAIQMIYFSRSRQLDYLD